MRAVQITRFGGPEVLDVVDLPDPTPGEGQQLFDVSTAGVNYADTHHALPQDMPEPGRRGGPQFDEPGRTGAVGPRRPQRHRRSPGPRCGISPRSRC
jgi:NADPH2:quinone reductase